MRENREGNRSNRSLIPHNEIIDLYLKKKQPTTKIAKIAGITTTGVWNLLKRNNIKIRDKKETEFLKRRYDYQAIINDYKSGMFLRDVAKRYKIGASHTFRILKDNGIQSRGHEGGKGSDHCMWKGGISHDKDGYLINSERGKQTKYHRFLLQEALGRKLSPFEATHHINGNKADNRLENLAIMRKEEHNRFDTFLKFVKLKQNQKNLEKFCKKIGQFTWQFTKDDYSSVCTKYNLKPHNPFRKAKVRNLCSVKDCGKISFTTIGLCSKHYQRFMAEKRGYWRTGGGRNPIFLGKYSRVKNLKIKVETLLAN